jgi:hypothetical protein
MLDKLKKLKVRLKVNSGCSCKKGGVTYTYILPVRLDKTAVEAMKSFGKNIRPFHKTRMIKIESPDYSIVGIDKLREIKLIFKNTKNISQIVRRFEEALAAYVHGKKGK